MEAVAGGNFMIFAEDQQSGLKAAEAAADAIRANAPDVIMQFPGGVCRAGSKAGSLKYKLKASTNHPYCPTLRTLVPDTVVPEGVTCVYEIVMNGLTLDAVKKGMKEGVTAAIGVPGVVKISSGNYGGKLGPFKAYLEKPSAHPCQSQQRRLQLSQKHNIFRFLRRNFYLIRFNVSYPINQ